MRRDEGSVLVQAIGGALLALIVTVTMFDLGNIAIRRTALMTIATDVALQAATAIDIEALYRGSVGTELALDPIAAMDRANLAVMQADTSVLQDLRLDDVVVDGSAVRVVVSARVPAPLGRITGDRTMRMRATAAVTTPTRL